MCGASHAVCCVMCALYRMLRAVCCMLYTGRELYAVYLSTVCCIPLSLLYAVYLSAVERYTAYSIHRMLRAVCSMLYTACCVSTVCCDLCMLYAVCCIPHAACLLYAVTSVCCMLCALSTVCCVLSTACSVLYTLYPRHRMLYTV
jgi:hypothetical protein